MILLLSYTYLNSVYIGKVIISPSVHTTKTARETFLLVCSADIYPLSATGQRSVFEWFFDNSSLPSGVTISNTTKSGNTTYTNTLHFSPLLEIHAGMYTCQIGYRAVSTTIFVVGKDFVLARSNSY